MSGDLEFLVFANKYSHLYQKKKQKTKHQLKIDKQQKSIYKFPNRFHKRPYMEFYLVKILPNILFIYKTNYIPCNYFQNIIIFFPT